MEEIIVYKSKSGKVFQNKNDCILSDSKFDENEQSMLELKKEKDRINSICESFKNDFYKELKSYQTLSSNIRDYFSSDFVYWLNRIDNKIDFNNKISIVGDLSVQNRGVFDSGNYDSYSKNLSYNLSILANDKQILNEIIKILLHTQYNLEDKNGVAKKEIPESDLIDSSRHLSISSIFGAIKTSVSYSLKGDITSGNHILSFKMGINIKNIPFIKTDIEKYNSLSLVSKIVSDKANVLSVAIGQIKAQTIKEDANLEKLRIEFENADKIRIAAEHEYLKEVRSINERMDEMQKQKIDQIYADNNFSLTDLDRYSYLKYLFSSSVPKNTDNIWGEIK